jgi:putative PIN family toxin of toxin-antitoxin system
VRYGLRAVVDTNVWVSGIAFPDGAPGRVLQELRIGAFEAVASWRLAEEIVEVMRRPRMRALGIGESDVRDVLILLAPMLPDVEIDLTIRDPDDIPVVSAAISGAAEAIVTGDKDLLDDRDAIGWLAERNVEVVKSAEWLQRIG